MTSGTMPIVVCDDEAGCTNWEIDHYEMGASVPKLPEGWRWLDKSMGYVLCPDHQKGGSEE